VNESSPIDCRKCGYREVTRTAAFLCNAAICPCRAEFRKRELGLTPTIQPAPENE
jgi:hypothetical protein